MHSKKNGSCAILKFLIFLLIFSFLIACAPTKGPSPQTAASVQKEATKKEDKQQTTQEKKIKDESKINESLTKEELITKEEFLSKNIQFDFDSSKITQKSQKILKQKANWLIFNKDISIILEGHCDKRGTEEYNLALGDRRAKRVKKFLLNFGINEKRIEVISYGEEKPLVNEDTEDAWALNRRVQFLIK